MGSRPRSRSLARCRARPWNHGSRRRGGSRRGALALASERVTAVSQPPKAGVRYRYYASRPSLHGGAGTAKLGSISRVPALEIEQAIISALQKYITAQN